MSISAAQIKALREQMGAGMLDCKKALTETNGDMDAAKDWLRTKGLASAAKKAGRVAAEGLVAVAISADQKQGAIIEFNSETDFVSRNPDFQKITLEFAQLALKSGQDIETLLAATFSPTGRSVKDEVASLVGVIGENLHLRRVGQVSVTNGIVVHYIHNAVSSGLGKIGVLLALESEADIAHLSSLGKQIAMHVAAARPESLNIEALDPALIERERNVLIEQAKESGKPDNIIDKMVEGRIRKFYEEVVLLEQLFVVDGKTKIAEVVEQKAKEAGKPIALSGFVRFGLGEGIEKEESDFAEEVKKTAAGS